jgi:hypothetical protein
MTAVGVSSRKASGLSAAISVIPTFAIPLFRKEE